MAFVMSEHRYSEGEACKLLKASPQRVYRVYCAERLAVRRLKRKRLVRPAAESALLTRVNQELAIDFITDGLGTGRGIRMLTVVDSFTRECPAIEVDTSLCSRRVTRVLAQVIEERGKPEVIRCDNGPEFTSRHFLVWCEEKGIKPTHIQPGKPMPYRELQWALPRRMPKPQLVPYAGGRAEENRALEEGIQQGAAA